MTTKQQFDALVEQWQNHCDTVSFSSKMADYLDHNAYHQLVEIGPKAVPWIIDRYRADHLPWAFVLQEITGIEMISDNNWFSPSEVREHWLKWWENQVQAPEFPTTDAEPTHTENP